MYTFFYLNVHILFKITILSVMTALIFQLLEKTEYKNLAGFVFSLFYFTSHGKRNCTALLRVSFPISVTTLIF